MEKTKSSLHAHANGGLTTVLSIDGGGIRGIIPRVMLAFLESKLRWSLLSNESVNLLVVTFIRDNDEEGSRKAVGIGVHLLCSKFLNSIQAPISHNIYWKELSMLVYVSVAFLIVHIVKGKHYCNGHTSQQKQDNSNEYPKNHEMKL
ncbi:unnamed protein product [Prunus armeniaca]